MRLYLVQHGEAVPEEVDRDRPLSPKGRADAEALGRLLRDAEARPERILHSGKTRARQTAERLAAALSPPAGMGVTSGLTPKDPVEPIARQAASWVADTLLVGHLPSIARLASYLLTGDVEEVALGYKPGSLACLERPEDGPWTLIWMLRPELVPHGD
jgi:phosphohistidine phosphatase